MRAVRIAALIVIIAAGIAFFAASKQPSGFSVPPWPVWRLIQHGMPWIQSLFSKITPPPVEVMTKVYAYKTSALIITCTRLKIADILKHGPKSVAEIAKLTRTHPPFLHRALRALATHHIFRELPPRSVAEATLDPPPLDTVFYENTPQSEVLMEDHPQSIYNLVLWSLEDYNNWFMTYDLLKAPERKEEHSLTSFWGQLEGDAARRKMFAKFMVEKSFLGNEATVIDYDFSAFRTIVDAGGGYGGLSRYLLRYTPNDTRVLLFDLPEVISDAKVYWKESASRDIRDAAVLDRLEFVPGSFFDTATIPKGADAYVFCGVIHDWGDEAVAKIFKNIRAAMKPTSKLVLVEFLVQPRQEPNPVKTSIDMQMLVVADRDARERTEGEFRKLLADAGMKLTRVAEVRSYVSVIEGVPV